MTEILTMGEMLVEIMREQEDVPLDQAGTFRGPLSQRRAGHLH